MKKWVIALSLLLIFAGLIFIPLSNTSIQSQPPNPPRREDVILIKNMTYLWNPNNFIYGSSVNLSKGDIIYLDINPPSAWGEFANPTPTDDYGTVSGYKGPIFIYVDFNYTNEKGETKTTQIEIVYYYHISTFKMVLGANKPIHIYQNRSETLEVKNPDDMPRIEGNVTFTGEYKIWISGPFEISTPPDWNPKTPVIVPVYLYKYKWKPETLQPYRPLLPIGIFCIFSGITVLYWKTKGEKVKHYRKRIPIYKTKRV